MYIAIDSKIAHVDLARALRFAIRKETLIDILHEVYSKYNWDDYRIYFIK